MYFLVHQSENCISLHDCSLHDCLPSIINLKVDSHFYSVKTTNKYIVKSLVDLLPLICFYRFIFSKIFSLLFVVVVFVCLFICGAFVVWLVGFFL